MGPSDQWYPRHAYAELTHCNTLLTRAYAGRRSRGKYKKQLTRAYAARVLEFQTRGSSNKTDNSGWAHGCSMGILYIYVYWLLPIACSIYICILAIGYCLLLIHIHVTPGAPEGAETVDGVPSRQLKAAPATQ